MRRLHNRSYDLLSGFDWFVPDFRGIVMLLIFLAIGFAASLAVSVALMHAGGMDFFQTYGQVIVYPIMFIPAMIYSSVKSSSNRLFSDGVALDSSNFGGYGKVAILLLALAGTISLSFICDPLMLLLPPMSDSIKEAMEALLNGPMWLTLLSVSVLAPIFEEWLFRGMILRGLLQKTRPIWAILISSAAFAVIHMNIWQALPAFILGCFFAYVYYKTGSLKLTMAMHCANNTLSAVMSNIDAFKDMETYMDIFPQKGLYWAAFAAMAIIFILCFQRFRMKAPESERGSCDKVSCSL